jgi:hypothetical protein
VKTIAQRVQGPLIVDEPVAVYGLVVTHVHVTRRGELHLHGVVLGDVRVSPYGRAAIHGRVGGTVFNDDGEVEVRGVVGNVCSSDDASTVIAETAIIQRGRLRTASTTRQ